MRRNIVGIVVILAILVSRSVGFLLGQQRPVGQPSSSTTAGALCTVAGPTIGVELRVVSGTSPVAGALVYGEDVGVSICDSIPQTMSAHLQQTRTNATGWANLLDGGFGNYFISINYSSTTYQISVQAEPIAVTYAIVNIASGNVTTSVCYSCG